MSKKREQQQARQACIVLAFICFVLAIGMVSYGRLEGILILLPAFVFAVIAFPSIPEMIRSLFVEVRKVSEKRRMAKLASKARPESAVVETSVATPSEVNAVIADIQDFRPYRRPRSEGELEDLLMQHLRGRYSSLRTQLQSERTQIDGQIGKIGIEVKFQPDEAAYDRLFGQVEKYLRHLSYIIVIIGYERSTESTEEFKKRLRNHGWDGRVFIVNK